MGNYEQLKQSVSDVIKTNGNQEITGSILQNVLLTIISTVGENATFAGVATPTTNPGTPDGSVFYLASESGTYTNFDAIELQDGLSVLMWNGSWSSQQIFSVDDVPTAGSENLVKSGGVQQELALGAVYDVSAKNPTAGPNNDSKWDSLSALLEDANLDTLIPINVRKGGMSIKFVQSSDNKYVQYRLISDTFNTTPANWQGVDDEPTVGSNNLVKSGGVKDSINKAIIESVKDSLAQTKKHINWDDNDDELYISDLDGNIVVKIDKEKTSMLHLYLKEMLETSHICDNDNNALYITDRFGNIVMSLEQAVLAINFLASNKDGLYITDRLGNIILKCDKDGVDYPGIVKQSDIPSIEEIESTKKIYFGADIRMIVVYGQSNSQNGNYPIPAYDFKDALIFASKTLSIRGLETLETDQEINEYLGNGFVPLQQYSGSLFTCGGISVKWMQMLAAYSHTDYEKLQQQLLPVIAGKVTNIQTLTNPNGAEYSQILKGVTAAKRYANALNKSFDMPGLAWIQGEGNIDTAPKTFYDYLWVFLSNINHDIKAITGQNNDIVMTVYQTCQSNRGSNIAMLKLAIDTGIDSEYQLDSGAAAYLQSGVQLVDRKYVHMSIPFYPYKTHETTNPLHLSWSDGLFNVFGAFISKAMAEDVNLHDNITCMHVKDYTVTQYGSSYVVDVNFEVPVPPLQFIAYDERFGNSASLTAVNGLEPNYGFNFANSETATEFVDIITDVQIAKLTHVQITCSTSPIGKYLTYAQRGSVSGGNLCDSAGKADTFMVGNDKCYMNNFCPMFSILIQ